MRIELKIDTASVQRAVGDIKDGLPRVLTRVLNRSLSEVRTLVKRGIAEDTGIPVSQVDKSLTSEEANFGRLVARLVVRGRRLPLTAFKARQTRKGVTYSVGSKGRTLAESAFIATMRSGHTGVFRRRGKFPALAGRLPIDELKGPSLPRVLANQWIARGWQKQGEAVVQKNLDRETKFFIERAGKGGVAA